MSSTARSSTPKSPTAGSDRSHLPAEADFEKIDGLASLLISARTSGQPIEAVPDELVPNDAVEAQLVDDHVAAVTGWPVLGWKIGCTSEHAQKLLGSPGPFSGRVYSVRDAGATVTAADFCSGPMLEGEFAFTIGRDIEPATEAHRREDVLDAVSEFRLAIELVGGRYKALVGTPLPLLIADAGSNTSLVLGPPIESPDLQNLGSVPAEMSVDGEVTGSGSGADVLGDPVAALVWLADHLSQRGIALQAGQVVSTGTATQLSPFALGATATASFAGLGSISVDYR